MNIETMRTLLNHYLIESEDVFFQNWVGLLDEIDMESLYKKYQALFTIEAIQDVRNKLDSETDSNLKRRLQALFGQMVLGYMEYASRETQKEILKKEARTTINWEGLDIPIRSLGVKILNEPDRLKRKDMIALKEDATNVEINPLRELWVENLFSIVHELGYSNYIELCEAAQNRDIRSFKKQMEGFLADSEAPFKKYLNFYLIREAGIPADEYAHEADISAVFRSSRYDQYFPSQNLVPIVTQTIGFMGFNFDKIRLDLEDRPKKKPRACVSAVNPPADVRLTIYPAGGYDDYAGFLHETGHGIHFTHERPDLDFEFKYWGDRGFTEGTAYLFQHITLNRSWLTDLIKMENPNDFIQFNAFLNVLRFRRLIGQLLFQLDLFEQQTTSGMQKLYQKYMSEAHGVKFEPSSYLNFDLEFYSAGYLRARMFELHLRQYLIKEFGETWWKNPKTSQFLVKLYRDGRKSRADDVVVQLGFDQLECKLYLEEQLKYLP